MKIVGILLALASIFLFMYTGQSLGNYLDIPGLLFVLFLNAGLFLAKFGKDVKVFWNKKEISEEARLFGEKCTLVTGFVGSLIGMIAILQNLSDPKALGPALAINFLIPLYAILLNLFIFNPRTVISHRGLLWIGILMIPQVLGVIILSKIFLPTSSFF